MYTITDLINWENLDFVEKCVVESYVGLETTFKTMSDLEDAVADALID